MVTPRSDSAAEPGSAAPGSDTPSPPGGNLIGDLHSDAEIVPRLLQTPRAAGVAGVLFLLDLRVRDHCPELVSEGSLAGYIAIPAVRLLSFWRALNRRPRGRSGFSGEMRRSALGSGA